MSQELPNRLYHYCSLQALRGIIEKKHLHMTNIFWMDDTTEGSWLYEVVKQELDRKPRDARTVFHEPFRQLLEDRGLSHVFCTCFSTDPDSRSQWLEYADDGHGFAIGFDPEMFDLKTSPQLKDIGLQSVIYNKQKQKQIAERIIDQLPKHGKEEGAGLVVRFAKINVWREAARCKNPAFKNEREWRLICRNNPGDALEFRERSGRHLIPFTTFPFDATKNPIREIRLGPRNQSQRNDTAVMKLLQRFGYDATQVDFVRSDIPLRPKY